MTHLFALITTASFHWTVEQIIAFGIIVWIWNHLGLSVKTTLIGNIVAIILLVFLVFIFRLV
jgi:hypothetical protein